MMFRERRAAELGTLAEDQGSIFVGPSSPTFGEEDGRVVLVEFTDPACETCAAFSPLVKRLMEKHSGKIRFVIRYAPFQYGADEVARILEAARKQDRFWETLDLLYRSQLWMVLVLGPRRSRRR